MSFDPTGEQQPLSAFWSRKSSKKENKKPVQYSSKHKRPLAARQSAQDEEPPAKKRKGNDSGASMSIVRGRRTSVLAEVGSQNAKGNRKQVDSDVVDLTGAQVSDDELTLPTTSKVLDTPVSADGSGVPIRRGAIARAALPTPPSTSNAKKRRSPAKKLLLHYPAPSTVEGVVGSLPTPEMSGRRPNHSRPRPLSRLRPDTLTARRCPENVRQPSSTLISSPDVARPKPTFYGGLPAGDFITYGAQRRAAQDTSDDPFALSTLSQASVPSSQADELHVPQQSHMNIHLTPMKDKPKATPTFKIPDLPAHSGSSSPSSSLTSYSSPPRADSYISQSKSKRVPSPNSQSRPSSPVTTDPLSPFQFKAPPPVALTREIVPSSQSQYILAPGSSPLRSSVSTVPLPVIRDSAEATRTMLWDQEMSGGEVVTIASSQCQIEREMKMSQRASQLFGRPSAIAQKGLSGISISDNALGSGHPEDDLSNVKRYSDSETNTMATGDTSPTPRAHTGPQSSPIITTIVIPRTPTPRRRSRSRASSGPNLPSAVGLYPSSLSAPPSHYGSLNDEPSWFAAERALDDTPRWNTNLENRNRKAKEPNTNASPRQGSLVYSHDYEEYFQPHSHYSRSQKRSQIIPPEIASTNAHIDGCAREAEDSATESESEPPVQEIEKQNRPSSSVTTLRGRSRLDCRCSQRRSRHEGVLVELSDGAAENSETESESETDILDFVTGLNNQTRAEPDTDASADGLRQSDLRRDVQDAQGKHGPLTVSPPHSDPFHPRHQSYNVPFSQDDIVQAGAPPNVSDVEAIQRYRMVSDGEGSMPLVLRDFLDMFQGEGSYPDSFPQSLR